MNKFLSLFIISAVGFGAYKVIQGAGASDVQQHLNQPTKKMFMMKYPEQPQQTNYVYNIKTEAPKISFPAQVQRPYDINSPAGIAEQVPSKKEVKINTEPKPTGTIITSSGFMSSAKPNYFKSDIVTKKNNVGYETYNPITKQGYSVMFQTKKEKKPISPSAYSLFNPNMSVGMVR